MGIHSRGGEENKHLNFNNGTGKLCHRLTPSTFTFFLCFTFFSVSFLFIGCTQTHRAITALSTTKTTISSSPPPQSPSTPSQVNNSAPSSSTDQAEIASTPIPTPTKAPIITNNTPVPTQTTQTLPAGTCNSTSFPGYDFQTIGSNTASTNNRIDLIVNGGGSLCGSPNQGSGYVNEPCVSVTICSPSNPNNCQTINNILLDTGSYGLRLFSSTITVPLTPITNGGSTLAECVGFGDGTSQWGPVKYAYVQLGNEPKIAAPILVIDANYSSPPPACTSAQSRPDTSPSVAGYNGILGVGLLAQDCGSNCVNSANNGQYFSCGNNNCSCGATPALKAQVTNPVTLLPIDNNGVVLELPAISATGSTTVTGSLYFGIDTKSNNTSNGKTKFPASMNSLSFNANFSAYSTNTLTSIIDSGTSTLYIPPAPTLPDCSTYDSSYAGFFCPASNQNLSVTLSGYNGSPSQNIIFSVGNAYQIYNTNNYVFSNLAVSSGTTSHFFDLGLPFFFGRKVFVGNEMSKSGPFWAF